MTPHPHPPLPVPAAHPSVLPPLEVQRILWLRQCPRPQQMIVLAAIVLVQVVATQVRDLLHFFLLRIDKMTYSVVVMFKTISHHFLQHPGAW